MAYDREVKLKVDVDTKDGVKGVKKLDKGMSNFGKTLKNVTLLAGAAVVGGIALIGKEAIDQALALEATEAKFTTVFEGMTDEVDAFIKEMQKITPITKAEGRKFTSSIQDILKPMGFATREATDLTKETFELAAALASFSGGTISVEQATRALTSAYVGERESLKTLGIVINQAAVDERALKIAREDNRKEVTRQDKALATYQLALEQSTDATKAFNEENLTTIERFKIIQSRFKDIAADVGMRLLPTLNNVAEWIANTGIPWVQDFIEAFLENDAIIVAWQGLSDSLSDLAQNIFPELGENGAEAGNRIAESLAPLLTVLEAIIDLADLVVSIFEAIADIPVIGKLLTTSGFTSLSNLINDAKNLSGARIQAYQTQQYASQYGQVAEARTTPIVVNTRLEVDGNEIARSTSRARSQQIDFAGSGF